MFKESLICIIVAIVIYQIFLDFRKKDKKEDTKQQTEENKMISPLPPQKPMVYETPNSFVHPQLGKPDKIIEEGYLYLIENPNPWVGIIFNQNKKNNYIFILRIQDPSKFSNNRANNWKNVIPEFSINFQTGEMLIPSPDEESALGLANLILSNLTNQLEFENIIKNNLISISINKIKAHPSIRKKIIEQIQENISIDNSHNLNHNVDYEEDLAETGTASTNSTENKEEYNKSGFTAYEGTEFSFLS